MRKILLNVLLSWLLFIFIVITGAFLLYTVEQIGTIMYLFPLMFFAMFVLKEVKDYTRKSKKKDL